MNRREGGGGGDRSGRTVVTNRARTGISGGDGDGNGSGGFGEGVRWAYDVKSSVVRGREGGTREVGNCCWVVWRCGVRDGRRKCC